VSLDNVSRKTLNANLVCNTVSVGAYMRKFFATDRFDSIMAIRGKILGFSRAENVNDIVDAVLALVKS